MIVDVVDEVLGIELAGGHQVSAGADLLAGAAGVIAGVGVRCCAHREECRGPGTRAKAPKTSMFATSTEVVDLTLHCMPSDSIESCSSPAEAKNAWTWPVVNPSHTSACSARIHS